MPTTITDDRITSDHTSHHAWKALPWQGEGWIVTWTGKTFNSRNDAITAITLAEVFAELWSDLYRTAGNDQHMHGSWPLFADLAGELEMTPDEAWRQLADTYPLLGSGR